MDIAKNIRQRRLELGLTLQEVADALGLSISTVSRYESGDIKHMGIDKLEDYAAVLRATPFQLLGWEEMGDVEETTYPTDPRLDAVFDAWGEMSETDKQFVADLIKRIKSEDVE